MPQADARAGFERSLLGLTLENKLEVSDLELAHCSSEELRRELEKADVVYVECGNTFYLHYHMVKQMKDGDDNFKSLISPFLDKGKSHKPNPQSRTWYFVLAYYECTHPALPHEQTHYDSLFQVFMY